MSHWFKPSTRVPLLRSITTQPVRCLVYYRPYDGPEGIYILAWDTREKYWVDDVQNEYVCDRDDVLRWMPLPDDPDDLTPAQGPSKSVAEPTSEQCSDRAVVADTESEISFAAWHPQLGGYCSHAVVTFSKQSYNGPSCFTVDNYHNGEFPCATEQSLHYCAAEQLIRFGTTILEMQVKHQEELNGSVAGERVRCDVAEIDALIARLTALRRT
jgi:hypothetical protein